MTDSIHSFDNGCTEAVVDSRYFMSDVFTAWDEDRNDYRTVSKEFNKARITDTDKKILILLAKWPLLPASTIIKAAAKNVHVINDGRQKPDRRDEYERIKYLFDHGYLSRFDAEDRKSGFVKSVYFVSAATYEAMPLLMEKRMVRADIEGLAVTTMLEMSQLSRWCAFALLNQPKKDIRFIEYRTRRDAKDQFTEAIIEKGEYRPLRKNGVRCRFHVISAPKDRSRDRLLAFLRKMYSIDTVCRDEEMDAHEDIFCYMVIVCENILAMEHLAADVNNLASGCDVEPLNEDRILYSLETDGDVSLGAFRFLHRIRFSGGNIVHDQAGFR